MKMSLVHVKDRGGLMHPAKNVTDLCLLAEKALRHVIDAKGLSSRTLTAVLTLSCHGKKTAAALSVCHSCCHPDQRHSKKIHID